MFTVPPQVQEVPRSVSSLGSVGNTHPVYFWQKQTEAASRQSRSRKAGNKNSRCLLTNGRCSATTEGKWPNTVWGSQRIRQAWRSAFKKRSRWGVKLRVGQNKTASHTHTHTQGTWRHVQWDQGVSALVLTTQNISFRWERVWQRRFPITCVKGQLHAMFASVSRDFLWVLACSCDSHMISSIHQSTCCTR